MRIVQKRSPYKDKAGFALIAVWDLENIMTFIFLDFSFILHLAQHLASLSKFLSRYSTATLTFLLTAHWPASSANCDLLCLSQFQLGTSPGQPPGISSKTLPGGRDLTFESCPGAGNSTRAGIL